MPKQWPRRTGDGPERRKRQLWLTKPALPHHPGLRVRDLPLPVPADGLPVGGLPVAAAAAASSSGAKRFASSVSRRSMPFTIAMFACCSSSWPSAARSSPAASPASAPRISVRSLAPSSRPGTSPCCRLPLATDFAALASRSTAPFCCIRGCARGLSLDFLEQPRRRFGD
jgi:hypothetical protein